MNFVALCRLACYTNKNGPFGKQIMFKKNTVNCFAIFLYISYFTN